MDDDICKSVEANYCLKLTVLINDLVNVTMQTKM